MSDTWLDIYGAGGGGESAGPSEADLRAAGFAFTGGDAGSWQAPSGWVPDASSPMGVRPPPQGRGYFVQSNDDGGSSSTWVPEADPLDTWAPGVGFNTALIPEGFDWKQYVGANPDLKAAGIDSAIEAQRHFALHGVAENRAGLPADYVKKAAEEQKIFESGEIYNPKAGQLLGYIYDNSASPQWNADVRPHVREGGEGQIIEYYNDNPSKSIKPAYSDSKKIPIYEPPFVLSYDAKRALTPNEKLNVVAQLAGAEDAKVQWPSYNGKMNAAYASPKLESLFGVSNIQYLTNIDPTKNDWNSQAISIETPTEKKKWYEKAISNPAFGLALALSGIPVGLAGALGGGALGTIGAGAILGGGMAAATGGNILKGALAGGIGSGVSGLSAGATSSLTKTLVSSGLSQGVASTIAGAVTGAATSALTGGDPMQGALGGAANLAIKSGLDSSGILSGLSPVEASAITKAATSAAAAAIKGGDPLQAALSGALSALPSISFTTGSTTSLSPIDPEAAPVVDVDSAINDMLAQQEPLDIDWNEYFKPEQSIPISSTEDILARLTEQDADQTDIAKFLETGTFSPDFYGEVPSQDAPAQTLTPDEVENYLSSISSEETMQPYTGELLSSGDALDFLYEGAPEIAPDMVPVAEYDDAPIREVPVAEYDGSAYQDDMPPVQPYTDETGVSNFPEVQPYLTDKSLSLDIGKLLSSLVGGSSGSSASGGAGKSPSTTGQTPATQPTAGLGQQYQQPDMSSLISLLGLMQKKDSQQPAPIPLAGQISPYDFSTNLMESIYKTPKMAQGGSINDLMEILRG